MLDSFLSFSPYYQTDKNTAGVTQRCRIRGLPHLHWGSFLIQPGFSPQQANKSPCFSLRSAGLHPLHHRFKLFLCSKHYSNSHTQWRAKSSLYRRQIPHVTCLPCKAPAPGPAFQIRTLHQQRPPRDSPSRCHSPISHPTL